MQGTALLRAGAVVATLDNGVEVMVPQFVKTGDTIRLDIENLRYMDRAKARRT